MKRSTTIAAIVLGLFLVFVSEAAAVPVTTSFTARIQDDTGPVNGLVNLNFKIFDAGTAGTMVWEEMHTGVAADEGLVYVALGSIAPTTNGLDQTVFNGDALFLEVAVNGDVQSPRVQILSVPYATHAATADTLGSLAPADVALSNHNHNSLYASISHNHDARYAALSHTHALPTLSCVTRSVVSASAAQNATTSITAACDAGYVVTGGGCRISSGSVSGRKMLDTYASGNGWYCRQHNESTINLTVRAEARCCRIQ